MARGQWRVRRGNPTAGQVVTLLVRALVRQAPRPTSPAPRRCLLDPGSTVLRYSTIAFLSLLLSCIGTYDPFSDLSNAGVYIQSRSIDHGDTVSVFATESLEVIVTVKEEVEELTVGAAGNRLWPGHDTTIAADRFDSEPFVFRISFSDTGWQEIALRALRSDGHRVGETLEVYVSSPLKQSPVSGFFGEPLRLSTPPVGDSDARYVWSFGAGAVYSSAVCSTRVTVNTATPVDTGWLWVADSAVRSPGVPFLFSLHDTTPPSVVCVNDGYAGADTIYSGDSLLGLKVRITDRGRPGVDSASVDGAPFDDTYGDTYVKFLSGLHHHTSADPLRVNVFALDHYEFGNSTTKVFTVIYSDTIPVAPGVRLRLDVPSRDSVRTALGTYLISGTIEAVGVDTLPVVVTVQGADSSLSQELRATRAVGEWGCAVDLTLGHNNLTILALDTTGTDTLDVLRRTIIHTADEPDTIGPRIASVLADSVPADGYFTSGSEIALMINAVDEGSGIEQVSVNGESAAAGENGTWFHDTVSVVHRPRGNELRIVALDKQGNTAERTVVVFRNRLPLFTRTAASSYLTVGSRLIDSVTAVDPDGDEMVISRHEGPSGMEVTAEGSISWMPSPADTGRHDIVLRAWDGYQPSFSSFSLYVSPPGGGRGPVTFATTVESFPRYLEAGKDTLVVTLRSAPGTGVAPLHYSVRLTGEDALLLDDTLSLLRWAPHEADTGFNQLIVMVTDAFGYSDTLYPGIVVVPPNRPCSLSVSHAAPVRSNGVIDLNRLGRADTLRFRIHDSDDPAHERHTITISQARAKSTSVIDSAASDTFRIAIDPRDIDGYDTLIAAVKDRGGTTDTVELVLYMGVPPETPVLIAPTDGAAVGTPATLVWSARDPDGDHLFYDIYTGTHPDTLTRAVSVADTSHTLPGLTVGTEYYWKVEAKDWKRGVSSAVRSFTVE